MRGQSHFQNQPTAARYLFARYRFDKLVLERDLPKSSASLKPEMSVLHKIHAYCTDPLSEELLGLLDNVDPEVKHRAKDDGTTMTVAG